jgi:hypothetical protein
MAGFVDDTKGQTNEMRTAKPMPMETLLAQMQDDAQLWGNLLRISGGALEIPKCNYYVMQWQFNEHGKPALNKTIHTKMHLTAGNDHKHITLSNDSGSPKPIKHWAPGRPHYAPRKSNTRCSSPRATNMPASSWPAL